MGDEYVVSSIPYAVCMWSSWMLYNCLEDNGDLMPISTASTRVKPCHIHMKHDDETVEVEDRGQKTPVHDNRMTTIPVNVTSTYMMDIWKFYSYRNPNHNLYSIIRWMCRYSLPLLPQLPTSTVNTNILRLSHTPGWHQSMLLKRLAHSANYYHSCHYQSSWSTIINVSSTVVVYHLQVIRTSRFDSHMLWGI